MKWAPCSRKISTARFVCAAPRARTEMTNRPSPSRGLVIREIRHLVHERELDRSQQPRGRAVALAAAVERLRPIVAA